MILQAQPIFHPAPHQRHRVQHINLAGELSGAQVAEVAGVHFASVDKYVLSNRKRGEHAPGRWFFPRGIDLGPYVLGRIEVVNVVNFHTREAVHDPDFTLGHDQARPTSPLQLLPSRRMLDPFSIHCIVSPQVIEAACVAAPAEDVEAAVVGGTGVVAPVRRAWVSAGEERPFVDRGVEWVELVELLVVRIPTAEDVNDPPDGRHGDSDARRRNVAGDVGDRPGEFVEVEDVELVVDGEARGEFAAEGVGVLP